MGKVKKISEDDFFKMNKTFNIWLKKKKDKLIEEIATAKARKYFKKFVKKWNKEDLQSIYYDEEKLLSKYGDLLTQKSKQSILQEKMSEIAQNLREYQNALEGVTNMYDFKKDEDIHSKELKKQNRKEADDEDIDPDAPLRQRTRNEVNYDREEDAKLRRDQFKYDRKRQQKEITNELEELAPKQVGREAMLDKKKGINQKLNGSKDDGDEFNDEFLMGGDSFQKAKMREEQFQRRRQENYHARNYETEQKRNDYQQREERQMQSALDKNNYMNRFK